MADLQDKDRLGEGDFIVSGTLSLKMEMVFKHCSNNDSTFLCFFFGRDHVNSCYTILSRGCDIMDKKGLK